MHLNVSKNVIYSLLSFVLNAALLFFGYRLVAQSVGLSDIGLWALLFSITNLVKFGDPGSGQAIEKFAAPLNKDILDEKIEIQKIIFSAVSLGLLINATLVLLAFFLLNAILHIFIEADKYAYALELLPALLLIFFFRTFANTMFSILRALHIGYISSVCDTLSTIICLVLIFILVPEMGLLGLAYSFILQSIISILFSYAYIYYKFDFLRLKNINIQLGRWRLLLTYSLKIQCLSAVNGLWEPFVKYSIYLNSDLDIVGLYEIAIKLVTTLRGGLNNALIASLPATIFKLKDKKEINIFYRKQVLFFFRSNIFIYISTIIISPLISYFTLNKLDSNLIILLVIVGAGYLANSYSVASYNLGIASGIIKYNFVVSIFLLIFVICITFLFDFSQLIFFLVVLHSTAQLVASIYLKRKNEEIFL